RERRNTSATVHGCCARTNRARLSQVLPRSPWGMALAQPAGMSVTAERRSGRLSFRTILGVRASAIAIAGAALAGCMSTPTNKQTAHKGETLEFSGWVPIPFSDIEVQRLEQRNGGV